MVTLALLTACGGGAKLAEFEPTGMSVGLFATGDGTWTVDYSLIATELLDPAGIDATVDGTPLEQLSECFEGDGVSVCGPAWWQLQDYTPDGTAFEGQIRDGSLRIAMTQEGAFADNTFTPPSAAVTLPAATGGTLSFAYAGAMPLDLVFTTTIRTTPTMTTSPGYAVTAGGIDVTVPPNPVGVYDLEFLAVYRFAPDCTIDGDPAECILGATSPLLHVPVTLVE